MDETGGNVTRLPDDYDRQISALYRQLPLEEPPAAIDARLIELAVTACAAVPQNPAPVLRRVRVPMPVAALLLVAAGLLPLLAIDVEQKIVSEGIVAPAPEVPTLSAEEDAPTAGAPPLESGDMPGGAAVEQPPPQPEPQVTVGEPAERLEEIKVLLARGMDREAWLRFAEFRREYPGYRIPDSLLTSLGEARDEIVGGRAAAP